MSYRHAALSGAVVGLWGGGGEVARKLRSWGSFSSEGGGEAPGISLSAKRAKWFAAFVMGRANRPS